MDSTFSELVDVSPEIQDALATGRVVALESSVIAQGMPPPHNLAVAHRCVAAVAGAGGIAATIGVIEGRIVVGLSTAQLERLADPANKPRKACVRDLAPLLAQRLDAGTTVSATLLIAHQVGIRVFATGGIGGVQRRLSPGEPLDVSSDLTELSRRPLCVVSAGPKAILDVPATAEVLETLGIPVLGYRTNELPAFFSDWSGVKLEHRFDEPKDLARACHLHWDALGQRSAVLVCVPPPHSLSKGEVEAAMMVALRDAHAHGLTGKDATPFLLRAVAKATEGRSLQANLDLLVNNAHVAGLIAAAL